MVDNKKKETAKKRNTTAVSTKKKGSFKFILFMFILGAIIPFGKPTLLVCLGLLPTLVALFTDTDKHKSGVATIGFMNLAGVVPFLLELWGRGQTMEAALDIVKQPITWLVMLGAAGIGQLLLYVVPPAITTLTIIRMEARIRMLYDGLEQLKAIWGPDVANNKTLEAVRKHEGT